MPEKTFVKTSTLFNNYAKKRYANLLHFTKSTVKQTKCSLQTQNTYFDEEE